MSKRGENHVTIGSAFTLTDTSAAIVKESILTLFGKFEPQSGLTGKRLNLPIPSKRSKFRTRAWPFDISPLGRSSEAPRSLRRYDFSDRNF